jgi:hypothetical protein
MEAELIYQIMLLAKLGFSFLVSTTESCTSIILDTQLYGQIEAIRHYSDRVVIDKIGFESQVYFR